MKGSTADSRNRFEVYYKLLGHEVYTKLLTVFEKFCFYGKTFTNFTMDYSQFVSFLVKNDILNKQLTKTQAELVFNKVRKNSKCKLKLTLAIRFQEFFSLLAEFGKLYYPWEKDELKCLNYFVSRHLRTLPSFQKGSEEKLLERWYFFLEAPEFCGEVRKHLLNLHRLFLRHKERDLKLGETTCTANFLKMCKELKVVPVFQSAKEIISVWRI